MAREYTSTRSRYRTHRTRFAGAGGLTIKFPELTQCHPRQGRFTVDFRPPTSRQYRYGSVCATEVVATRTTRAEIEFVMVSTRNAWLLVLCAAPLKRLGYSHMNFLISGAAMTLINRVAPTDVVMCPAWAGYRTTKLKKFHKWATAGDRCLMHAVLETAQIVS
jgi:hypothetical protein